MTRLSMTSVWRAGVAVAVVTMCCAPTAAAQFETPSRAFHNETSLPLDGRHRDVTCASCHRLGIYKGTPTKCFDCHWVRAQDDRYRLRLGSQCEQCHRTTSWTDTRWDHAATTGMTLGVAHRQVTCQACHANNTFRATQTSCVSCHQQDYQRTRTPNHAAAGFPTTCEACHRVSDTSFNQARVDHSVNFPLVGVHAQQTCATCHKGAVFVGTPRDCVGCHRPVYDRTTAPNHAAAGFQTTCDSCHRAADTTWSQGTFNHRFPIASGPHRTTCATCHQGTNFQAFTCLVCHEHDRTRMDDKHRGRAGYRYDSLACYSCHPNGRH